MAKIKVKNSVTVSQEKILQDTSAELQNVKKEFQTTQQTLASTEEQVRVAISFRQMFLCPGASEGPDPQAAAGRSAAPSPCLTSPSEPHPLCHAASVVTQLSSDCPHCFDHNLLYLWDIKTNKNVQTSRLAYNQQKDKVVIHPCSTYLGGGV